MDTPRKSSRIDLGKWVAIPVFTLLLVWNLMDSSLLVEYLFPIDAMKILWFLNHLLAVAFLVLVIFLYFRRGSATATTRSLPVVFIAMLAVVLPFVMPFLRNAAHTGAATLAISSLIITAGLAFALTALLTLGKSFSIIPQNRDLVVQGPYRLVRHPIYLGEIITYLGMALAGISVPNVLVVLLLILCQTYRAIQEEKLLAETFPEYLHYASKTPAFIPGLRPNEIKILHNMMRFSNRFEEDIHMIEKNRCGKKAAVIGVVLALSLISGSLLLKAQMGTPVPGPEEHAATKPRQLDAASKKLTANGDASDQTRAYDRQEVERILRADTLEIRPTEVHRNKQYERLGQDLATWNEDNAGAPACQLNDQTTAKRGHAALNGKHEGSCSLHY
jgi:protein-S-isoprenylcysteine O-methyltransferase Ste14